MGDEVVDDVEPSIEKKQGGKRLETHRCPRSEKRAAYVKILWIDGYVVKKKDNVTVKVNW